jgi:hypothetical protein
MIAEFSLLLTCGMSLMWCLMPRAQVTSGFFRIQMLIVMGLSVLALLTMGQLTAASGERLAGGLLLAARTGAGLALGFAYAGSMLWLLDRRRAGTIAMAGVMVSAFASLVCSRGGLMWLTTAAGAFYFLSSFATASVLGGAVTGMLLGHWYLTAPTMSIEPLKTLSRYFAAAVVLRLVVSAIGWMIAGQELHAGVHWTWFALRWLAGIVGPFVISVMALRILRYRNTQAATGVLFAGVILTFIGEMSAALLYSELRVPL